MALRWKKNIYKHLNNVHHEVLISDTDDTLLMMVVEVKENGINCGWCTHTIENHLPAFDSLKQDLCVGKLVHKQGSIPSLDEAKKLAKAYAVSKLSVAAPKKANKKEYRITREDLDSVTDIELAFGTTKLLPPYELIPEEFKPNAPQNIYTRLIHCMFMGLELPAGDIKFHEGFRDEKAPKQLNRTVLAHLKSFEPKHQHKIAGLAYLVSLVCEMTPVSTKEPV